MSVPRPSNNAPQAGRRDQMFLSFARDMWTSSHGQNM